MEEEIKEALEEADELNEEVSETLGDVEEDGAAYTAGDDAIKVDVPTE